MFNDSASLTFKVKADASGVKATFADVSKSIRDAFKPADAAGVKASFSGIEKAIDATQKAYSTSAARMRDENGRFVKSFKDVDAEVAQTAGKIRGTFSNAFSGGFFGGLAGTITTSFISVLSELPGRVADIFGEMTRLASEQQNAFKGLESIAIFKGIDSKEATAAVQNLRLVRAGIIDVSSASTALKSLLASGFGLDQATVLLERFSDSAAFGKQSALSFSEAIERTAEGLKQGNSNLFDAAGVTKNLSVILEEQGFKLEDLSDKTKKAGAQQALFNGILQETNANVGDADKLTQGWTGSTAALSTAQDNLYKAIGGVIINNKDLIALVNTLTLGINQQVDSYKDLEGQSVKTTNTMVSDFARLTLGAIKFGNGVKAAMAEAGQGIAFVLKAAQLGFLSITSAVQGALNVAIVDPINRAIDGLNTLVRGLKSLPNAAGFGAFAAVPEIPNVPQANTFSQQREDISRQMDFLFKDMGGAWKKMLKENANIEENYRKAREKQNVIDFSGLTKKFAPKAGETGAGAAAGTGKSASGGKSTADTGKEFDKEFRKFADELGFVVSRVKGGAINSTSKHPAGLAGDLSIKGKTVDEIVNVLAEGIKKGYRVLDERFVGAIPGVKSTGPNAHFESAGSRKPSLFVENRPDLYGGQAGLDYLKKLDEDRRNKKTSTDDIAKFADERQKKLDDAAAKQAKLDDDAATRQKKAREETLRDQIKALDTEVTLRESANRIILAEQQGLLDAQAINESGFARVRAAIEEDALDLRRKNKEKERVLVEKFNNQALADFERQAALELERAKPEERAEIARRQADERLALERSIAAEETNIRTELQRLDDEIAEKRTNNSNEIAANARKNIQQQKEDELELLEIRRQVAEAEARLIDFRQAQERKILVNEVEASRGKARLAAIEELRRFDVQEIERKRRTHINELGDAEEREKAAAIERIENKEAEEIALTEITRKYAAERDLINDTARDETRETNQGASADSAAAAGPDFSLAGIFGESDIFGEQGVDDIVSRNQAISASFSDMGATIQGALEGMAQATGKAVEGWVLYGGSIGKALKQAAAAELAHIAGVATIKALYQTAEGIAALFYNPGAAAQHFIAAGIYASIAVGSALAGRALAGGGSKAGASAFNRETAGGFGSSGGGSPRSGAGANDNRITEENRQSAPAAAEKREITFRIPPGMATREVVEDFNSRGVFHDLILKVVEG